MAEGKGKYNLLMLLAALIWGFGFVAQRLASHFIGPFTFTGIRFALGALAVLFFMKISKKNNKEKRKEIKPKKTFLYGFIAGIAIFIGAVLQQAGLESTTVGKAAFITGLYIVLVPIAGIFLKHTNSLKIWISAGIAVIGLYLLTIQGDFSISRGDFLELIGAFIWAAHILMLDRFSKKVDTLKLAFFQFATCAILSIILAFIFENVQLANVLKAAWPLLYGGLISIGVGSTLQVVCQRHANPMHAAIILSLETVFAVLAGLLMLSEQMALKEYIGCALMFAGMLITQIPSRQKKSAVLQETE